MPDGRESNRKKNTTEKKNILRIYKYTDETKKHVGENVDELVMQDCVVSVNFGQGNAAVEHQWKDAIDKKNTRVAVEAFVTA